MEREDLWLASLKRNPGKTDAEFISGLRDVPDLVLDLLSVPGLAARLLRDRLLGETEEAKVRAWLLQAEDDGLAKRQTRQMMSQPEPEEQWSITEQGIDYLRGRGIG